MVSVLITGANRGLGLEFAREYAEENARVFACCRNPDGAAELKALEAQSRGRVSLHALDVTDDAMVDGLAATLSKETIDILINNAGIASDLRRATFDLADWESAFRVNTIAPFRMALAFKPHMAKSAVKKLVTVSSGRSSNARARGEDFAYCASKAAVNNAMRNLSVLWAPEGFIVTVFGPGAVKTDMNPNGAMTPRESVSGMRRKIESLGRENNGGFYDWMGRDIPW